MLLTDINVEKLRGILADLSPVHRSAGGRLSFLTNPDPGVQVQNLYLETKAGAIDLLTSITGVGGFERVRAHAMGRDRDLLAVRELEAIARKLK